MGKKYKVFVDDSEIYSGDFSEVPTKFRGKIVEAFSEWGEIMGKRSLNEMIYSLFFWYDDKEYVCDRCNQIYDENIHCSDCNIGLESRNKYDKDEKISHLLTCVGMITHIEVIK